MDTNVSHAPSDFLAAFKGENKRVPVWFMRQAGRYLPEYQALKASRTLNQMFRDPDTAAEITLQPIRLIGVDAAIMFADILTLPSAMGFNIEFVNGKGPVIDNPITSGADADRMHDIDGLEYVQTMIRKVNKGLPPHIPLIGFAGSPFTVLMYLMDKPLKLAVTDEKAYHRLMEILTRNTITYLKLQKEAGINAFQLFDTWAGQLRRADYEKFVLPYVQSIFKAIDLPSIYFLKNCSHLFNQMEQSGADVLSVCETVDLAALTTKCGIQGNFFNGLLYASDDVIIAETRRILTAAKARFPKYIFNLNHGVMPDVSPEKLKLIVREAHQFNWRA